MTQTKPERLRETRRLARLALAHFDWGYDRLRLLADGYNVTYRVDRGNERWALRVARQGERARLGAVEHEVAWLQALAQDTQLILAEPIHWGTFEGRACVLMKWVEGAQRSKGLTPRMLEAVGRTHRTLHTHGAQWTLPAGWSRPRFDDPWLGEPTPENRGEDGAVFAECAEAIQPVLDELLGAQCHVLHGDLHQGNYRFQAGCKVGVIDFDDCCTGHPAQDLAITTYYLRKHPRSAELGAALARGYGPGYPLTPRLEATLHVWRALGLYASLQNHTSAEVRALLPKMRTGWLALARTFLK